ncbi:Putative RNA-binding protein 15B [Fukomys damarensis]|uniref:Putative RNA-binding protein 15B n=1 Tax=Fukomys damarensis TaxID=885580 RepID=A0A091D5S6_FUKDA|nr:Putative RNA-binding protein 15B [Fukomys damarensis]
MASSGRSSALKLAARGEPGRFRRVAPLISISELAGPGSAAVQGYKTLSPEPCAACGAPRGGCSINSSPLGRDQTAPVAHYRAGGVAYSNFQHPQIARGQPTAALGPPLKVCARGGRTSQRNSSSSSSSSTAATTPPPGPPAPANPLSYLQLDYCGLYDDHRNPYGYPAMSEEDLMLEDDQRATLTLFIRNVRHSRSEVEQRIKKYRIIEEVVIKRPAQGQAGAFAFLQFQNLDMAHRAKVAISDWVIGRNPIKID